MSLSDFEPLPLPLPLLMTTSPFSVVFMYSMLSWLRPESPVIEEMFRELKSNSSSPGKLLLVSLSFLLLLYMFGLIWNSVLIRKGFNDCVLTLGMLSQLESAHSMMWNMFDRKDVCMASVRDSLSIELKRSSVSRLIVSLALSFPVEATAVPVVDTVVVRSIVCATGVLLILVCVVVAVVSVLPSTSRSIIHASQHFPAGAVLPV